MEVGILLAYILSIRTFTENEVRLKSILKEVLRLCLGGFGKTHVECLGRVSE